MKIAYLNSFKPSGILARCLLLYYMGYVVMVDIMVTTLFLDNNKDNVFFNNKSSVMKPPSF